VPSSIRFPAPLAAGEDKCGARAAWLILRRFGIRTTSARILREVCWRAGVGTHTVGIAAALATYGLRVEFSTDPDESPDPAEVPFYHRLAVLAVSVSPGMSLHELQSRVVQGASVGVFYARATDDHFSVLERIEDDRCVLHDTQMPTARLEKRRAGQGVLRQAVVAFAPGTG